MPVVLLGSIRHSPVRFTGHGGSSALAIRSFNDLPFPLVSVVCARANCLGKAGFQAGQESSTTHIFGESPYGSGRYFDLRLAPDYAESLRCGKAQAAAMARSFGIFRNSAHVPLLAGCNRRGRFRTAKNDEARKHQNNDGHLRGRCNR